MCILVLYVKSSSLVTQPILFKFGLRTPLILAAMANTTGIAAMLFVYKLIVKMNWKVIRKILILRD